MKYPIISKVMRYRGHPNGWPKCSLCDKKAFAKVEIQTSPFRGEDEYETRCTDHRSTAVRKGTRP